MFGKGDKVMGKSEVAEKIKKLLELSKSCNEHEAALAAQKAKEILEKYNMTLTDVQIHTSEMDELYMKILKKGMMKQGEKVYYKKLPHWCLYLCHIDQYFNTTFILHRKSGISVLGAKADVEVVSYVYQYLVKEIERLTEVHMGGFKGMPFTTQMGIRQAYAIGAAKGVVGKLKDEAQVRATPRTASGSDLVAVKGDALKKFVGMKYPRLGKASVKSRLRLDLSSMAKGMEDGRNITIRRGVKTGERGTLLE